MVTTKLHSKAINAVKDGLGAFKKISAQMEKAIKLSDDSIAADQVVVKDATDRIAEQEVYRTQAMNLKGNLDSLLEGKVLVEKPIEEEKEDLPQPVE